MVEEFAWATRGEGSRGGRLLARHEEPEMDRGDKARGAAFKTGISDDSLVEYLSLCHRVNGREKSNKDESHHIMVQFDVFFGCCSQKMSMLIGTPGKFVIPDPAYPPSGSYVKLHLSIRHPKSVGMRRKFDPVGSFDAVANGLCLDIVKMFEELRGRIVSRTAEGLNKGKLD